MARIATKTVVTVVVTVVKDYHKRFGEIESSFNCVVRLWS